jgi:hypothetical protein
MSIHVKLFYFSHESHLACVIVGVAHTYAPLSLDKVRAMMLLDFKVLTYL